MLVITELLYRSCYEINYEKKLTINTSGEKIFTISFTGAGVECEKIQDGSKNQGLGKGNYFFRCLRL